MINKKIKFHGLKIVGDLLTDEISRCLYATDASIYEELPEAVARPQNKNDCIAIVKFSNEHCIPLIPRTAGTSIAGQCVGSGIVVDVSRYMTEVVSNIEEDSIFVQPGVILDDLNDQLKEMGLRFAPDISTSNRCMIGGMIGNNAAGSHSVKYGTTREHVIELETILSDGSVAMFGPLTNNQLNKKQELRNLEGDIYRKLFRIIDENREKILQAFPKSGIIRRNTGYPLDYLANSQPWNADGPSFNLAPFLCGSEGTLAFITKAKLNLIPVVKSRVLVCIHYSDLIQALESVNELLNFNPAAIELIDAKILNLAKQNITQNKNRFWIEGEPKAVLAVEYHGDDTFLREKVMELTSWLKETKKGYAAPVINGHDIQRVWDIRKAGLGLLMGVKNSKKPVAIIEDAAVLPSDLPEYVREIKSLMKFHNTECVYYGHASVGLLHLRPELDLAVKDDRDKFKAIGEAVSGIISKYKGALSGEHGDGRVRTPYLKKQLGADVYQLFLDVKKLFDPNQIFNPDKIISSRTNLINLRAIHGLSDELESQFNWPGNMGFGDALNQCNGIGVCRKSKGKGLMCPTYMATKEEKFSTRGRANALRFAMNSKAPDKYILTSELKLIMDTCLSCKGCKSECPSNVDMAKLKSEYLYRYNKLAGKSLEVMLAKHHGFFLRLASLSPGVANLVLNSHTLKKRLGLQGNVSLPLFAVGNAARLKGKQNLELSKYPNVILLIDIYNRFFEPENTNAAIRVLNKTGYSVIPIYMRKSLRLLLSYGLLDEAKRYLASLYKKLLSYPEVPVIGLEPSELFALKDEAIDLVDATNKTGNRDILFRYYLFDQFLNEVDINEKIKQVSVSDKDNYLIHIHCHQKSIADDTDAVNLIKKLTDGNVKVTQSGCCGMAGSFGYKHPSLSSKVANLSLIPEIRRADDSTVLVASGFSCRHQILRETGVKAYHPAVVLDLHTA